MSRSDKGDICYRRIWFCFWVSSIICLVTSDDLLLYDPTMVEIFRPSQKWDLHGVVAVLVSKVNF